MTPRRSKRTNSTTDSPVPSRTPSRKAAKPILEKEPELIADILFEDTEIAVSISSKEDNDQDDFIESHANTVKSSDVETVQTATEANLASKGKSTFFLSQDFIA